MWCTVHAAFKSSRLLSCSQLLVHAAAGGVGLVAIEYAVWVATFACGSAGMPFKHSVVSQAQASSRSSSRDAATFVHGVATFLRGERIHAVLNSLSDDFIVASFTLSAEHATFAEIGKRRIWSFAHHAISGTLAWTRYEPIAVDVDMVDCPPWIHQLLLLLENRLASGVIQPLPLVVFSFAKHVQLAFRLLQRGSNVGKVVVYVCAASLKRPGGSGSSVITGGTGALGLVTARWLAQQAAQCLVLASRSGSAAVGASVEWEGLCKMSAEVSLHQCNISESVDVGALVSCAGSGLPPISSLWHTAGVLADGVFSMQSATSLCRVYGPKAHAAWLLESALSTFAIHAWVLF